MHASNGLSFGVEIELLIVVLVAIAVKVGLSPAAVIETHIQAQVCISILNDPSLIGREKAIGNAKLLIVFHVAVDHPEWLVLVGRYVKTLQSDQTRTERDQHYILDTNRCSRAMEPDP